MILRIEGRRSVTVNAVYGTMSRWERADEVRWWRQMAKAKCPIRGRGTIFGPVVITATPLAKNHRHMQDTGACLPAVKAAIDGMVDAGLLPHDGPDVVRRIIYEAPLVGDTDGLLLLIERFTR